MHTLLPWVGESKNRRHKFKVRKASFNTNTRGNFTQRVVGVCNELSVEVVEVDITTAFKGNWTGTWIGKVCGWERFREIWIKRGQVGLD